MSTIHKALEALARAYGLELEYTDNWGRVHRTDLETARRFLAAKGLVIHGDALDPAPEVLVISEEAPPKIGRAHV